MKKTVLLLGALSMMAIVSCKKNEEVPAPPVPMETPPPAPVPAPTTTPPPVPEAQPNEDEANGTSVSVGKDGIDVNTKNDTKKTKVTVNNGGAAVEVKK